MDSLRGRFRPGMELCNMAGVTIDKTEKESAGTTPTRIGLYANDRFFHLLHLHLDGSQFSRPSHADYFGFGDGMEVGLFPYLWTRR